MNSQTLEAGLAYLRGGLSVVPVKTDGSKAPHGEWKQYETSLATEGQAHYWWGNGHCYGVGVLGGKISGNLEHLDFDADAERVYPAWCQMVEEEAPGLVARLSVRTTPSNGYHASYRCPEVEIPGNTKIARRASDKKAYIETRGEGGQVLAPGCPPECHPTKREYLHHSGPRLSKVQTITAAERAILWRCAKVFDEIAEEASATTEVKAGRPGDEYNQRGPDWAEILEPHGWAVAKRDGGVRFWKRPGKDEVGHSATTGVCTSKAGLDLFAVFSSSAEPFPGPDGVHQCSTHSKFSAYALLNHKGDFKTAAKALAAEGYGEPTKAKKKTNEDGSPVAVEAVDDPHRVARTYYIKRPTDRFFQNEWWRAQKVGYAKLDKADFLAEVVKHTKTEFDAHPVPNDDGECLVKKVSKSIIGNVEQALQSFAILPAATEIPSWITMPEGFAEDDGFVPPFPAKEMVAFKNGLAHLPSIARGSTGFMPGTPHLFTTNVMDFDFIENVMVPSAWLTFLQSVWPDDPDAIDTLQEWFGYCLTPCTKQQKILTIVGPKRSGKGTIARVQRALIGLQNTAALTLASLGTNFGLWPLVGKLVAIISDARLSGKTDVAQVTERLLSISGEDAQPVDRKFLPPLICTLPTRFMILTNELPRLNDPSGALVGRLIILQQEKSFYGNEDIGLTDRLLAELPAIFHWAVEGWRRLQDRGRFIQPESGRQLIRIMEDLSSTIGVFLRERCAIEPGAECFARDLFAEWKAWSEQNGNHIGNEQTFGRDLRAAVPAITVRQPRFEGKQLRAYVGIRIGFGRTDTQ